MGVPALENKIIFHVCTISSKFLSQYNVFDVVQTDLGTQIYVHKQCFKCGVKLRACRIKSILLLERRTVMR